MNNNYVSGVFVGKNANNIVNISYCEGFNCMSIIKQLYMSNINSVDVELDFSSFSDAYNVSVQMTGLMFYLIIDVICLFLMIPIIVIIGVSFAKISTLSNTDTHERIKTSIYVLKILSIVILIIPMILITAIMYISQTNLIENVLWSNIIFVELFALHLCIIIIKLMTFFDYYNNCKNVDI